MMSTDTQYIGKSSVVAGAKAHRGLKLGSDHENPNSELERGRVRLWLVSLLLWRGCGKTVAHPFRTS